MTVILETKFTDRFRRLHQGKVRDIYQSPQWFLIDIERERLFMVATDRISVFDVILPDGIPDKGKILTLLSAFWFRKTADLIPNHFIDVVNKSWLDSKEGRRLLKGFPDYKRTEVKNQLEYRAMVVKKAQRVPVECVVRGYLSGSAWEEYRQSGTVSGMKMPPGLQESQELPEPLFTPTTKAETGHDMPMTIDEVRDLVGRATTQEIKEKSLAVYTYARDYALKRGIIIADTKMEFGFVDGQLILIDELLTPDSSRFWGIDTYKVGQSQPSFDKQPVRDWTAQTGWNKQYPGPNLPPEVIEATTKRYREAYEKLTGKKLA